MSSSAVQIRFAVEFATFLVAIAGAALVALRPALIGASSRARVTLPVGFVAIAVAAFLHGSLVVGKGADSTIAALRLGGVLLVAVGTIRWDTEPTFRRILLAGLFLMAVAEAVGLAGSDTAASWIRAGGTLGVGVVLFTSSRRSIPARVVTSAAATLLLVVLAVSVALSAVIANNVRDEALRRVQTRAGSVISKIDNDTGVALKSANLLSIAERNANGPVVTRLSDHPGPSADIAGGLSDLATSLFSQGPLMYLTDRGFVVAVTELNSSEATLLAGSAPVRDALQSGVQQAAVQVVGRKALAIGVSPVKVGARFVGVVVASVALDPSYLNVSAFTEPQLHLAIVGHDGLLASHGSSGLPAGDVVRVGQKALRDAAPASATTGGFFVAAQPKTLSTGATVVAVVAAEPTTLVDNTRNSLFRTLFLVALGASLLALVVALTVGDRIGAGLRRLTAAAEGIQRGDLSARAAVRSEDEIGVLGETFDSMATSIESLADELRQAADDEAQLRNRLEAVVAGMGEALFAVDSNGRLTTFNRAAEDLVGKPASAALGRPVDKVVKLLGWK